MNIKDIYNKIKIKIDMYNFKKMLLNGTESYNFESNQISTFSHYIINELFLETNSKLLPNSKLKSNIAKIKKYWYLIESIINDNDLEKFNSAEEYWLVHTANLLKLLLKTETYIIKSDTTLEMTYNFFCFLCLLSTIYHPDYKYDLMLEIPFNRVDSALILLANIKIKITPEMLERIVNNGVNDTLNQYDGYLLYVNHNRPATTFFETILDWSDIPESLKMMYELKEKIG